MTERARARPAFKTLAAVIVGLLAATTRAGAQTPPGAQGAVQREILILQVVGGGGALTPAERQQAALINQVATRAAPRSWASEDAHDARLLQRMAAHDTILTATIQEGGRLAAEKGVGSEPALQPVMDMERAIIRAHDPTIAWAAPNLVTEASLRNLGEAAAWVGAHGGPTPTPGDPAAERDAFRRGFASYPATLQTAYAHIGRNTATARAFMADVKPAQVAPFVKRHLANEPEASRAGPGAASALLMQDLYDETVRRNWKPAGGASYAGLTAAVSNSIQQRIMRTQMDSLRSAFGRD